MVYVGECPCSQAIYTEIFSEVSEGQQLIFKCFSRTSLYICIQTCVAGERNTAGGKRCQNWKIRYGPHVTFSFV